MLDKRTRSKFNEHNFRKIKEQDPNWYQTWIRLRKQVKEALDDLKLLAEKLPEDEQSILFNSKTLNPLFIALLESSTYGRKLNPRLTAIAATMARNGLMKCRIQYEYIETEKAIRDKIIEELNGTSEITSAIQNKVELQSKLQNI